MSQHLSVDRHGPVAVLTIRNAARLNALSPDILAALGAAAEALDADPAVRAAVLTGEGDRAFCAGADIGAWGDMAPFDFARAWIVDGHRVFDRIASLRVPIVAALNGHALGGGLELAAACDLRIAVEAAEIGLPEAAIGVVPGWSGTQRLARRLPQAAVREMALTGARLSAARAHQLGFLNQVVAADAPAAALRMAERAAALAPRAVETAKMTLNAAEGESRAAMIDALAGALIAGTADKAEGVAAFRDKRKPVFRGE